MVKKRNLRPVNPYRTADFKARVEKAVQKGVSSYPREKWNEYFYWQAAQDGYADIIRDNMRGPDAEALFAYWEQLGMEPDNTTSAILKRAEKAHFGRCVDDEM